MVDAKLFNKTCMRCGSPLIHVEMGIFSCPKCDRFTLGGKMPLKGRR